MNILVIDDHSFLKEGVELRILQIYPQANCFFTSNVKCALIKVVEDKINLVLCDLEFDNDTNYDGFHFIKKVKELNLQIKVIAFTNYNSYRIMNKVRKGGFNSFLLKTCSFQEFSDTLTGVIKTEGEYFSVSMKILLKKRDNIKMSMFSDSLYGISDLSQKELEVVILTAKTRNRIALAELICVSPHTIDSYYKSILQKLNIKSRIGVQFFANEFMDELLKRKSQS